jgi:DNA-binding LacI/PurR family transcriptional regulator
VPVLSPYRRTVEHGSDTDTQARELLRLPDPPTAVLACNDAQAFGVYRAPGEVGLRIPQDLSVVGFDDLPRHSGPSRR